MSPQTIKSKNIIIIILSCALALSVGYCIYLFVNAPAALIGPTHETTSPVGADFFFKRGVKDEDAHTDIGEFRRLKQADDPRMVTYEASQIQTYLDCAYKTLTKSKPAPLNFHWTVGFYFVKKKISGTQRLDFYVTPTLVGKLNGKDTAIDFFAYASTTALYGHNPILSCAAPTASETSQLAPNADAGNSYDAGELWP